MDRALTALSSLQATYVSRARDPVFDQVSRVTLFGRDGEPLAGLATGRAVPAGAEGPDPISVRLDGDPRVWLTTDELEFPADPLTWTDRAIIDLAPQRIMEIAVVALDGRELKVTLDDFGRVLLEQGVVPAGFEPTVLITGFRGLNFDDVRAPDGDEGAPWRMGLQTDRGLGVTYTVKVHPDDAGVWLTLAAVPGRGADTREEARQFNARHEGWAYHLERFALQPLMEPGALDGPAVP